MSDELDTPGGVIFDPDGGQSASLTYDEVAGLLKVTPQTVMEWVKRGQMESPLYLGSTARFRIASVQEVMHKGLQLPGTHTPALSPRAAVGKLGAAARALKTKRKKPAKKPAAKKPAAKKPTTKATKKGKL